MKTNSRAPSLAKNHRNLSASGSQGPFQPPRNRTTAMHEMVMTFANSPRKNRPNFMLEYSVWKPATSSPSASGRSNGARLVSASAVIMKMMNASSPNGVKTNHSRRWTSTMSTRESEPANSSTGMVESPIASSYEII